MSRRRNGPTDQQRRAIAPATSVWVGASAGTGKTKVLTDRVLTLMLRRVRPDAILCLTFTKAAAAEMTNRLLAVLGDWSVADEPDLAADVKDLLGADPDAATLRHARRLFAAVLDLPGGMRIQTIHAFCDSLLRRFPVEADLAPHFDVIDERTADEMIADARDELIADARERVDAPLAEALAELTRAAGEDRFNALMKALASERGRIARLLDRHGGVDGFVAALRARLDVVGARDDVIAAACAEAAFDAAALRAAASLLVSGSKTDRERGEAMAPWLADPARRVALFDDYCLAFLTRKDLKPQARLITKSLGGEDSVAGTALRAEARRLEAVLERCRAATVASGTAALVRLADALLARYGAHKHRRAVLDYDDLILRTRHLLERAGAAAWVLYKLDGGIDHVLIDEAQDTNPDQWRVVRAIAEEFFAGTGARADARTVFAVGDAKQSIFSFQRADPDAFAAMRDFFRARVEAAERTWDTVDLTVSFRSAPAVLKVVDAVFADATAADGVVTPDETLHHEPIRAGAPGLVELWPLVLPADAEPMEAWTPPLEYRPGDDPSARLAAVIAGRIRRWLDSGEMLESAGRPIRPGDIMVLVRHRTAFVPTLVNELKANGVPVAGVDRMVLTHQLAVMDLMALARFVLLPEDDLNLAVVLKGPLVGFGDDALFALAWDRGDNVALWTALGRRAQETPLFAAAHDLLADLLAQADYVTPFAFFADILGRRRGREKLLARLGVEAGDPIAEFLSLALAYERLHPPSLQGFLHWVEAGESQIKRELEQAERDEVRVITVHGAKGLEAPVVFLPDTVAKPQSRLPLFWLGGGPMDDPDLLLWSPNKASDDAIAAAERQRAQAREMQEYRRLLYVALTRARDRLYVCGWQQRVAPADDCWHRLVEGAMARIGEAAAFDFRADHPRHGWDGPGWRYADPPAAASVQRGAAPGAAPAALAPLPDWAVRPPPAEPAPARPLAPSRPDEADPPVRAPVGPDRGAAFHRGTLIHRLLQSLPEVPPDRRDAAARRFLARPVHRLAPADQDRFRAEALAVLAHPDLAPAFAPGAQAEVPLVGLVNGRAIAGQVDRLAVTGAAVLLVDYKTNRPPPAAVDGVPALYLRQMAAYRALLKDIYPGKSIVCAILWTDGPRLMALPDGLLAAHAP
ncbi:MAG: double-strand break repair helicase AddA [Rhodospirillales bacterium]